MMKTALRTGLLLLLPLLSLPAFSAAQENPNEALPYLQAGPFIFHPSLTLKETYNSNVFATPTDVKGDFITSVMPALVVSLPFRTHEISAYANVDIVTFGKHSSEDVAPYRFGGLGNFNIGDRVNLRVGDDYGWNYETPFESPTGTVGRYTSNTPAVSLRYAFVDVAQLRVDYSRTTLRYKVGTYRSRDEQLAAAYLYYRFQPRTSAFVEYDFKSVDFKEGVPDNDNDVHTGFVGASWEISELSKGTAKVGFLAKNFKDSATKNFQTWTASVDVTHSLTDAASVKLAAKRDVNEGKYLATRYYTTTAVDGEFTYRFLDRLSGALRGAYGQDTFSDIIAGDTKLREDNTISAGIGARYAFNSWLSFALDYALTDRDSNISHYSATENAVALTITAYR